MITDLCTWRCKRQCYCTLHLLQVFSSNHTWNIVQTSYCQLWRFTVSVSAAVVILEGLELVCASESHDVCVVIKKWSKVRHKMMKIFCCCWLTCGCLTLEMFLRSFHASFFIFRIFGWLRSGTGGIIGLIGRVLNWGGIIIGYVWSEQEEWSSCPVPSSKLIYFSCAFPCHIQTFISAPSEPDRIWVSDV